MRDKIKAYLTEIGRKGGSVKSAKKNRGTAHYQAMAAKSAAVRKLKAQARKEKAS